jgi:hypothetical protein
VFDVGMFAGAILPRHREIEERLWRRGVQLGVNHSFPWLLDPPIHSFLPAAGLMLCRRSEHLNAAVCVCAGHKAS